MQLAYLQPLVWLVPTIPTGYVYHINFPGGDLFNPVFVVNKGLGTDQSGVQFQNGTIIYIGSYNSFSAAQMACETNFSGTAQRVVAPIPSPTSPNQLSTPVTPMAPVNTDLAAVPATPVPEAPLDGQPYVRLNGGWAIQVPIEAPTDGKAYGRSNGAWVAVPPEGPDDGKMYGRKSLTWVTGTPGPG